MTDTVISLAGWPSGLPEVERKIINRLITAAFDEGCLIEVREGEEDEELVSPTKSRKLIQQATAASDLTLYCLHKGGTYVGTFVLIHGNGEDVVSDYSWPRGGNSELMDAIYEKARAE